MATTIQTAVTKYTVGLFGAAAGGYMNGLAAHFVNGGSEQSFVDALVNTVEFRTYVIDWKNASVTNAQKAAAIVSNLLSTNSGTAYTQGVAAVQAMLDGGQSFSTAAYTAINFIATTSDAAYADYKTAFNTRVDNALAYNAAGGNSTNLFELQAQASTTVTLTNGTDIRTGNSFNAPQVYTPGGDDRINSLQDEDTLTGIGTNPTLTATLGNANDNGAAIITPTLSNIQTINVAFTGSGGTAVTALDLQDAGTAVNAVNVTRVSQASNTAEVGNIMVAVPTMSLTNSNSNQAGVVEFSFNAGALAGSNTGTMTLSNVSVNNLNIGQNTSAIGARGVATQGYENLTLASTGSANVIGTLNAPMDTGTAGVLTITGSQNLRLGAMTNVVNAANAALTEVTGLHTAATGPQGAGGRISTIDASAFTGNLTLVLDNILDVGKADTSGVVQNVTVTGGTGNDTFALYDAIQAGDSLNGGNGTDNLIMYSGSSIASVAGSIETVTALADGSTGNVAADFDFLPQVTGIVVRNISSAAGVNATEANVNFSLTDMTATQAAGITIQHGTTGNNQLNAAATGNTTITAAVKTNSAADTLGITIAEGMNTDPRANFTVVTAIAGNTSTFENLTVTDSDSESNSIELTNFTQFTGTVTLTGGAAGTFINFDVDTAGADVTAVTTGATADGGQTQQGLLGLDTNGTAVDFATGNIFDVGVLATQVRLGAATINAANEASNVIVRVNTNAASAVGAQSITTGSGNDVVIFDMLSDNRAGLTISDTVAGGTGTDTLVIDGHGVNVTLGASEWTNVSGFENIRLVGLGGAFTYALTLTDALITANGVSGLINIINDNDVSNDTASGANTASTGVESAVTIDARLLSASNSFTYNGEENAGVTADRFIFVDANINGKAVIDGGATDNVAATNSGANGDVLDIRNTAVATAGDLANIKNVGTIAFNNDTATAQVLTLQLNDSVIDAMVDSYHTAATGVDIETLNVTLNDAAVTELNVAGVTLGLNLDVVGITAKSALNVTLNNVANNAAIDTLALSASGGSITVANFETTADGLAVPGAALDKIQLSKSAFAALTSAVGAGFSVGAEFLANATGVAAAAGNRIIFNNTTGDVWYDADGNAAGAAVKIATLTGVTDLAAADFVIVA